MSSYIITGEKLREVVWTGTAAVNPSAQTLVGHYFVDPTLPQVAQATYGPTGALAILSGRFVGIGKGNTALANSATDRGTPITTANGLTVKPMGVAHQNMAKPAQDSSGAHTMPDAVVVKNAQCSVAYVAAISDAYGTLAAGDRLTAHAGAVTRLTADTAYTASLSNQQFALRGAQVKFKPQATYYVNNGSNSTNIDLTGANLAGVLPQIVGVKNNAGSAVSATNASNLVWNTSTNLWKYSGTTAQEVWFTYGQDADQIGGELVRINPLSNVREYDKLFPYVKTGSYEGPLSELFGDMVAMTTADRSAVTFTVSGGAGYVLQSSKNVVIDPRSAVTIEIQGTVNDGGTVTSYSASDWYTLPNANDTRYQTVHSGLIGKYHSVDWVEGRVQFSSALTITAARITYKQITSPFTPNFAPGQIGLTDGAISGTGAGTPAHLNASGVSGELIFWAN